jgi:hypothetical protein
MSVLQSASARQSVALGAGALVERSSTPATKDCSHILSAMAALMASK